MIEVSKKKGESSFVLKDDNVRSFLKMRMMLLLVTYCDAMSVTAEGGGGSFSIQLFLIT